MLLAGLLLRLLRPSGLLLPSTLLASLPLSPFLRSIHVSMKSVNDILPPGGSRSRVQASSGGGGGNRREGHGGCGCGDEGVAGGACCAASSCTSLDLMRACCADDRWAAGLAGWLWGEAGLCVLQLVTLCAATCMAFYAGDVLGSLVYNCCCCWCWCWC
jgi:hypothetical protein